MTDNRQWFLTKLVGTVLGFVTVISVSIGGANVLFDLKRDVIRVDDRQTTHEVKDEKSWDKAFSAIDSNRADIHRMELASARTETNQKEILRRLDELQAMLRNFEVVSQ